MTTLEWMHQARTHQMLLEDLLDEYHPSSHARPAPLPITAPGAEYACSILRTQIQAKEAGLYQTPVAQFRAALDTGDHDTAYGLLNSAWIGVPESTDCWSISGFKEAVALLEDPPLSDEEGSEYGVNMENYDRDDQESPTLPEYNPDEDM